MQPRRFLKRCSQTLILFGLMGAPWSVLAPPPSAKYDWNLDFKARQFSTTAYRTNALDLMLADVNALARDLKLPEKFPIQKADLVEVYIQPPSFADEGKFGTISTANYHYAASDDNALSFIQWNTNAFEPYLNGIKARYVAPRNEMKTNAAYTLATQWLAAVQVDIATLERDSTVRYMIPRVGNNYAPIFHVLWCQPESEIGEQPGRRIFEGYQIVVDVWLVEPEKQLLQLGVGRPYLVRKSLSVPNRDELLQQTDDEEMRRVFFTTAAYKTAAETCMLKEVNWLAGKLGLPEDLPIRPSGLVKVTIATPVIADMEGHLGTLRTKNYAYVTTFGNKLCWVQRNWNRIEELRNLAAMKQKYTLPKSQLNTNAAYTLATQWLAAVSVDVQALDRECALHVTPWDLGNSFVPLYEVAWAGTNSDREGVAVAVELLEPERLLKSLMVQKSQYMNRPPLKIENRQHLLSLTNRSDAAVKVPR